jgi:nucleolar complex protein 2
VYHEILITALTLIPKVLQHHLPVKETGSGRV